MDINKYGGYTGRYASHFIVAEHQKGKKTIRTIEPVYIYDKEFFQMNPIGYCENTLGLINPRIIAPCIRMNALLELDGIRLSLTGGSDSQGDGRDIYNHTYQLVLDQKLEKMIKNIIKYRERCQAKNIELPVTVYDGVSVDTNIEIYQCLIDKLGTKVYSMLFSKEKDCLQSSISKFENLTVLEQCKVICEIIKLFKCDAQTADLKLLGGKNGRIRKNCNISGLNTAYLINQSVTGLYETKFDLLK